MNRDSSDFPRTKQNETYKQQKTVVNHEEEMAIAVGNNMGRPKNVGVYREGNEHRALMKEVYNCVLYYS